MSLRGINYNAEGGGNWLADYVRLESEPVPEPSSAILLLFGAMGIGPLLRRRRA